MRNERLDRLVTNNKLGYWTARLYVDVAEVRIPEETTDDLREPLETVDCLLDTVSLIRNSSHHAADLR